VLKEGAESAGAVAVLPGTGAKIGEVSGADRVELEKLIAALGDPKESVSGKAQKDLESRLAGAATLLFAHRDDPDAKIRAGVRGLLTLYWQREAMERYFAAYERAVAKDSESREVPMRGLTMLVSYEAGQAYLALAPTAGTHDETEKRRVVEVRAALKKLDALPQSMTITPIVFSLGSARPLTDLLTPESPVNFDLDGDGRVEAWPWVRPETGILVWDPRGTGAITSGKQLFGSVTWWMFFTDGYHAMDALDDDRDGKLSGKELDGLAVWFDRNHNGVSEKGEVVTLSRAGIASISTRALSREGASPCNPVGLTMTDGRVLPTFDWVTGPWVAAGHGRAE
jgi:hypothetical protein